jgi:hypothetical protein
MPKFAIAQSTEVRDDEKSLFLLTGQEIEIELHGPNAEFWQRVKSLDDEMPNGKSLGNCTLDELDLIGDFFAGECTVEDLLANRCLSAAWLFQYAAMTPRPQE